MYTSNKISPSYQRIRGTVKSTGNHYLSKRDVINYFKYLHPKHNPKFDEKLKDKIPKDLKICERCGRWLNYSLPSYMANTGIMVKKEEINEITGEVTEIEKEKRERRRKIVKNPTIIPSFIHQINELSFLLCKECKQDKTEKDKNDELKEEATPDIEDIERFGITFKEIYFIK